MAAVNQMITGSRVKWKSSESAGTHVFDGEFSWYARDLLARETLSRKGKARVRTLCGIYSSEKTCRSEWRLLE